MKTISLCLGAILAGARLASAENAPLPKDMVLVNAFGKLSADWVIPSGHGQDCTPIIDPDGAPWLACKGRFLEGPAHAAVYMTDRPYEGLAWLPDGILLGVSGDQVGIYEIGDAMKADKGTAHIPFKPLGQYPGEKVAIYGGSGNVAYIVHSDGKESNLVLLVRKKDSWGLNQLLSTKFPITAVTGTGVRTFVATGRRITGLLAKTGADKHLALDASIIYDEPNRDVTALGYSQKLGLFYGTAQGTSFIGSRYHMLFLKTPNAKISLADGALYVLPAGGGVLKLHGIETFLAKDAEMAAQGAPADSPDEAKK